MTNALGNLVGNVPDDALAGTISILNSYSFWSFIIIAVTTSILVFATAIKMRGGLFSGVLYYFGAGMTLIFFGFVFTAVPASISLESTKIIHDILYTIGYVLMAVAAYRLYSFTKAS